MYNDRQFTRLGRFSSYYGWRGNVRRLIRISFPVLVAAALALPAAHAQNTNFSWKFGPVDLSSQQTAKFTFANPFCAFTAQQLDITLALTDLSGKVIQVQGQGNQTTPARKHAVISCDTSIQLEVPGNKIDPQIGT